MAGFEIDTSALAALAVELRATSAVLSVRLGPVVERGLVNIKADARARASGIGPHVAGYAARITYDRTGPLEGEVGPELGGQGSLGGILEFGSPTSGPHPHLHPALDAEAPKFDAAALTAAAVVLARL